MLMKKVFSVKFFGLSFFIITAILLYTTCARTIDTFPQSEGYEYFPLAVGDFRIFDKTDSTIDNSRPNALVSFIKIKEEITEKFIDLAGDTTYRIERYSCAACASPYDPNWKLDSVWTAKLAASATNGIYNRAIRAENNRIFVKLIFPLKNGTSWNGNQLYGTENNKQEYRMGALGKPYLTFPETVTVVQNADTAYNLQKHERRIEVYAKNIGLAYKDNMYWEFDCTNGCVGRKKIIFGKRTVLKLTAFGRR
jgi:hypothetical protein